MAVSLTTFARNFLTDKEGLIRSLKAPVLLWEAGDEKPQDPLLFGTQGGLAPSRPRRGNPVVLEVKKEGARTNAFTMGITVGRTENNDVVLEDHSISRFHAYFQHDEKAQRWKLFDAESKNGTWIGPLKLTPNKGELVPDRARLRFGFIEVTFFTPASFLDYLTGLAG